MDVHSGKSELVGQSVDGICSKKQVTKKNINQSRKDLGFFTPAIAKYKLDCEFAYRSYLWVGIHKLHHLMEHLMIHE